MLQANLGVKMTFILSFIPLLFLGSFNLLVIKISEFQDSAMIKGMIYTVEGISFMVGSFAIKYIGEKWRIERILFVCLIVIGSGKCCCILQEVRS